MACKLVNIEAPVSDNTMYIPELGIPEYCINYEIRTTSGINTIIREVLELHLRYGEMDVLSKKFNCEADCIPQNIAGMVITSPVNGKKLRINKKYAESWYKSSLTFSHTGKVYPNTIILKLERVD